jgi:hypothetical protein
LWVQPVSKCGNRLRIDFYRDGCLEICRLEQVEAACPYIEADELRDYS